MHAYTQICKTKKTSTNVTVSYIITNQRKIWKHQLLSCEMVDYLFLFVMLHMCVCVKEKKEFKHTFNTQWLMTPFHCLSY